MPYKRLWKIGSCKVGPPNERVLQLIFSPQMDKGIKDCTVLMATLVPYTGRSGLHTHSVDEIMHVITGRGKGVEGDKTFAIEPGTIIYMPAGVQHECRNFGDDTMQIFCVYISSLSNKQIDEYVRNSKVRIEQKRNCAK